MAGIKNAREEFESEKTYLTNAELVEKQTEFCILNANLEEGGQFGPAWALTIVYLDENGEHVSQTLYLSAGSNRKGVYKENSYRRWFFTKKAIYPIHQAVLVDGIANNGMKFYDLDDSPASIDPCPCMTGDFHSLVASLPSSQGDDEEIPDGPVSDSERDHYIDAIYELSNKMGWPVSKTELKKKDYKSLRKLYRNLGNLAARQG